MRGSTHAISAVTQIDFVQIQLKNFILGQHLFNADRQEGFLDFAHQGAFRAQEEVSGQLLGDGTGPLRSMAGNQRDRCGTEDTNGIDPVMIIETAVLRGDEGMHHHRWDLVQLERYTAFFTILGDQFALRAVNLHRYL
ncbi:hypothetical protein D3C75_899580 [compost metagenome]